MKTVVIGAGGVGGYFGGLLAEHYAGKPKEEVVFIARGDHGNQIRTYGLTLITDTETRIIKPTAVLSHLTECGIADLVLIAVKNYHLEDLIPQIRSICNEKTVIIPLQNGIGNFSMLQQARLPGKLCDGLVYVISEIQSPGIIRRQGSVQKLIFGREGGPVEDLKAVESYLADAGISVVLSDHPTRYKWLKFQFIGALSAVTAAHDKTIGEVLDNPKTSEAFINIMEEIEFVAAATGIQLPETATHKSYEIAKNSPPHATTSFQRDFKAGKPNELEAYLGNFIKIAKEKEIPVLVTESYYKELKKRSK